MAFNYSPLASTVSSILKEYGRTVVLRNNSIPGYDPATSVASAAAPVDTNRSAAIFSFGSRDTTIRGQMVQSKDKRCIMEPGVEPGPEDQIIDGSNVYSIVSLDEIKPATVVVAYDIHLRG